jgi:hypothetical protein
MNFLPALFLHSFLKLNTKNIGARLGSCRTGLTPALRDFLRDQWKSEMIQQLHTMSKWGFLKVEETLRVFLLIIKITGDECDK